MLTNLFTTVDRRLLMNLVIFHTVIIALSNWLVNFKLTAFGFVLAWAAFTFPLVVVASDLTVRLVGKQLGRMVVAVSFIPAIIASILVIKLGGAPNHIAMRIGFASGFAYLVSTLLDVYVFQYFREKYQAWYIAPTLSSIFATIIDTYAFFGAAFWNNVGSKFEHNWVEVATNHIVVKMVVSLLVIIPAYGIVLSWLQKKIQNQSGTVVTNQ
jgi:uncharacterized PurR-regulated membrane protein YhhQ (DUF165 family)